MTPYIRVERSFFRCCISCGRIAACVLPVVLLLRRQAVILRPQFRPHHPARGGKTLLAPLPSTFGALYVALVMGVLALLELRSIRRTAEERVAINKQRIEVEKQEREKRLEFEERRFKAEEAEREKRLEFEERRFKAEEAEREKRLEGEERRFAAEKGERDKLVQFREQEYERSQNQQQKSPSISPLPLQRTLVGHMMHWRRLSYLPYANTLFGERSQHFQEEKEALAKRFTPYLLKRCEALTAEGRHVFLLIDAGTTLYRFFEIIGEQTVKKWHEGQRWLERVHLATNNLPGIEQLIRTGKIAPWSRYSKLAIDDCHLCPGFHSRFLVRSLAKKQMKQFAGLDVHLVRVLTQLSLL